MLFRLVNCCCELGSFARMKRLIAALLACSTFWTYTCAAIPPGHGKRPKNIILMIGDGTGLAQLYAGYAANRGTLSIFEFAQAIGLSNTSSDDNFITDSAAGANAFSTGKKTKNGMLGMGPDSTALETIAEKAAKKGLSTALVVSCELQHATPAAFYAHQPNRGMYPQITADLYRSPISILVGGGLPYTDTSILKQQGFTISVGMDAMALNQGSRQVCFISADSAPARRSEGRGDALRKGSMHALQQVSKNRKGFFMMVEGSQIDWGCHNNDSNYVLEEVMDFDQTATAVLNWAKEDGNTLVIITADHECGGLTLTGWDSKNHKPYMDFSTTHHTAIMVPVFAYGPGAEQFTGVYENTAIYQKMVDLLGLK